MEPHDGEDNARIARHRNERVGWGFSTVEWGRDIEKHLPEVDGQGTYLVDSVTALLTNEMFGDMNGSINSAAVDKTTNGLIAFANTAENAVFVSDNIYCDAAFYDEWTEAFRKGLAEVDCRLAAECDVVAEFCCGQIIYYKGAKLL